MATGYVDLSSVDNPADGATMDPDWGDRVDLNFDAIESPPLAAVHIATNQTISSGGSGSAIQWDTETADTDSLHDNGTNPERITATKAGWYLVVVQVRWSANSTGRRRLNLRKNGAGGIFVSDNAVGGSDLTYQRIAWLFDLAASDYVDCVAYQNSGGNLNVQSWAYAQRLAGT